MGKFHLKTELQLAYSEIEVLISRLSVSNSEVNMLSSFSQEEISEKEKEFAYEKELKKAKSRVMFKKIKRSNIKL